VAGSPSVQPYLDRIEHHGSTEPDLATLAALQRAHMLAVPFENLDIHLGRRLVLDPAVNYRKIVERQRGGWCFELNGLFAWLLAQLGFDVTLLGSRVDGSQGAGSDLAHLLLQVDLDQAYIVDVGFGEGAFDPVPLAELPDGVISHLDDLTVVFTTQPRRLDEFQPMCDHLQTSPESPFVRRRVAHRALPDGRITLRDRTLIEESGDRRTERELAGDGEWRAVLAERFGIVLD
jgi:N-hydroxyarylamine O-acetyltransferase